MTTATAPAMDLKALAKDRWDTVTVGIDLGNAAAELNSTVMDKWMDATREILAATMHGARDDAEYTLLTQAEHRLIQMLGEQSEALVIEVETMRATA